MLVHEAHAWLGKLQAWLGNLQALTKCRLSQSCKTIIAHADVDVLHMQAGRLVTWRP